MVLPFFILVYLVYLICIGLCLLFVRHLLTDIISLATKKMTKIIIPQAPRRKSILPNASTHF